MINFILKFLILTLFSLSACSTPVVPVPSVLVGGTWENTLKNIDGASVVTTLEVKQSGSNFNATMTAKVIGNESETLKLLTKNIKFSGNIRGNKLSITDVDSDSEVTATSSSLTIS